MWLPIWNAEFFCNNKVRINPETVIKGLKDIEPVCHYPVAHLKIFPERINRKKWGDPVREHIAEELDP